LPHGGGPQSGELVQIEGNNEAMPFMTMAAGFFVGANSNAISSKLEILACYLLSKSGIPQLILNGDS
jgi:hypothetical protein